MLDAAVIISARPALGLARLAAQLRGLVGVLVVLASDQCSAPLARRVIAGAAPDLAVVVIDCSRWSPPFAFSCDQVARRFESLARKRLRDVAQKRNLGLLIALHMGWRHIIFCDDDIAGLTPGQLAHAREVLGQPGVSAVGWSFDSYPDHSVMFHAYRILDPLGRRFGVLEPFIGGGGILVRVDENVPFFTDLYNEDWIFLVEPIAQGGLRRVGSLAQDPFDPFRDPRVGFVQEFGEVVAEGLFYLLSEQIHHGGPNWLKASLQREYWQRFLDARRTLLTELLCNISDREPIGSPAGRTPLLGSMRATLHWSRLALEGAETSSGGVVPATGASVHGGITADMVVTWIERWQADRDRWRHRLHQVERPVEPLPIDDLAEKVGDLGVDRHRVNGRYDKPAAQLSRRAPVPCGPTFESHEPLPEGDSARQADLVGAVPAP